MKQIKIILILLLVVTSVFAQKSKPDINQEVLEWAQEWRKKKLPLKKKPLDKFNLQLEIILKKEYKRINSIESTADLDEAEKLSRDFPQAWSDIQRINPNVKGFLSSNPIFADIEQKVDDAKFLHYIIKSKIAFDNKEFATAVDIAIQHNSGNSKALENEKNIKCQTLSLFAQQIISESGNTDPTKFVKSVKQFMEFKEHVRFDFAQYPYLENLKERWNNYEEFLSVMRTKGYERLISTAENLIAMDSYVAVADLYELAKDISLNDEEKNRIRDLQITLNEYAIVYYEKEIESAFDAKNFTKADRLEKEMLTFNPYYKKRGTNKKVHYYKDELSIAFNNFDWPEAERLEGLISGLQPSYRPMLPEKKFVWLLDIAREYYQNKVWQKAEAKLEEALKIKGSFDKSPGKDLLTDTRNEIGYVLLWKGMEEAEVDNYDLAEKYFKQAENYLSEKEKARDRYLEARNSLGNLFLKEALRYNDNRHYHDAYTMAKKALNYLQIPTDAKMIINNVKPKITKTIAFAINVGDDGFNLSKSQEAEIRNKLWHKVKSNDGELVNVLSSHKIPIVNNMQEATRYAHSVGADRILVISVDSYEEYGGKDFYGRKKKATIRMEITESYPVTKINIFTGKPYTFCATRVIGHLCQTAYYRKYIDDVEVKMRFNSKWLDLSSDVSSNENSKSYSSSFYQEVWRTLPIEKKATYQGKIGYKKTMPDSKELSEYAGKECNWTAPLDQTHFKKDRKPVPSHMKLTYPKLLDFIEGISGKTTFSYRS